MCEGHLIKANLSIGAPLKCEWCGVEYKVSHPDPIGYRQFTGYGLRESKDLVDTILAALKANR
jgi:hypothetical protein